MVSHRSTNPSPAPTTSLCTIVSFAAATTCIQSDSTKLLFPASLNRHPTTVLIDSGADLNFISSALVKSLNLSTIPLVHPQRINLAASGSSLDITTQTVSTFLKLGPHPEEISFLVVPDLSFPIILGMAWLRENNPTIDWARRTVSLPSHTPSTPTDSEILALASTSPALQVYPFMETVNPSTVDEPPKFLAEYADVFSKTLADQLPPHRSCDFPINLEPNSSPPYSKVYSLTVEEKHAMKSWIDENRAKGFIRPSKSPYGAPCFFVKKKDGSLRLCVDYRRLNAITIKDRNPLPLISELIRNLGSSRVFTVLDLRGAYNLIRIKQGDEFKTAFVTPYGQFESLVMGFGPTNCPAHFQNLMNQIMKPMLGISVDVYLDDIVVHSKTIPEHWTHVRAVLDLLREHHLFCKLEKCHFGVASISFLGYIISGAGISMDPKKVSAIQDWPTPTNLKTIQEFLGFCNFYRRFIPNFSPISKPLTLLLQKDSDFLWTQSQTSAFEQLKAAFSSASMLKHPDDSKPFFVETDASDFGLGGVLSQTNAKNVLQPIAFYSRQLNAAERNYTIYDKELLAVYTCFSEWRQYLQGGLHPVTVYSDHKNLEFFMVSQKLTRRQARWSLFLNEFSFYIIHRPGKLNAQADLLSRRPDYDHSPAGENISLVLQESHLATLSLQQLHFRFGHPGFAILQKTISAVTGASIDQSSSTSPHCSPCSTGKATRPNIRPSSQSTHSHDLLEVISSDTQGPFPVIANDGSCNNIKFIDSKSKYCKMETIQDRSAASCLGPFKRFQARLERRTGRLIKNLRTDGGPEYMGVFLDHLESTGIVKQKCTPYNHNHPGQAERLHQSIMVKARAMHIASNLPPQFYADAQLTASYLHNRLLHGTASTTPYEQVYGHKPDVSHLRPFGCVGYAFIPIESRSSKLDDSAVACRLIGYADDDDTEEIKGYKVIKESDPTFVFYSSDVRFDESLPMLSLVGFEPFSRSTASLFDVLPYSDPFPTAPGHDDHSSSSRRITRSYAQAVTMQDPPLAPLSASLHYSASRVYKQ